MPSDRTLSLILLSVALGILLVGCGRQSQSARRVEELLQQADDLHNAGEFLSAVQVYDEAIRLDASSVQALYSRGASWMAAEEFEKAGTDFTAAIRLSPEDPSLYGSRALAHYSLGNYDEAVVDDTSAIQFGSAWPAEDLARVYYCRAMSHQGNGDSERAAADFAKSSELDPSGNLDPRTR